jgi:branched-chain amino acid transport system substrate-binding protein
MMRNGWRAALSIVLLLFVSMATPGAAQQPPIKIGVVGGLSGAAASIGQAWADAIKMGADEINAGGGILGRKVALSIRDTEFKVDVGVREAKDLVLREKVNFLLGAISSGVSLAISTSVSKENKIIQITAVGNTHRQTVELFQRYFFQVVPNTFMEGRAAASVAAKQQAWKTYYTIGYDYEFGRMQALAFVETVKKLRPDVKIVGQHWPPVGETDYTPYITSMLAAKPDVVYSNLFEAGLAGFVKQALPYGFFQKVKFVSLADVSSMMAVPEMPEGVLGYTRGEFYCENTPEMKKFTDAFHQRYKYYPVSYAVMGYDSLFMLKKAIEKAGTIETEAVVKVLEGFSYDSLRGKFTIRPLDHQADVPEYVGWTVKDPKYPFVILKDIVKVPGSQIIFTEDEVKQMRAAAKK